LAAQPEGIWQAKPTLGGGKYLSKSFSVLAHGNQMAYGIFSDSNRMGSI
jgi:hypothetical protein